MRLRVRRIFLMTAVVMTGACALGHFGNLSIPGEKFKHSAQENIARVLGSPVSIGHLSLGIFNHITLSELDLGKDFGGEPIRFSVEKVVLRYSPLRLLSRKFHAPSRVLLKSPHLVVEHQNFPYEAFEDFQFEAGSTSLTGLEIEKGRIDFISEAFETEMNLRDVRGHLKPAGIGKIRVEFEATSSGVISGQVKLFGTIDPIRQSHHLRLRLQEVTVYKPHGVPLYQASGEIVWLDDQIRFEAIKSKVQGWDAEISGTIDALEKLPRLMLDVKIGNPKALATLSLLADLETEELKGGLKTLGRPAKFFEGKVLKREQRILIEDLSLDGLNAGEGKIDLASGDYHFKWVQGGQEIEARSNLFLNRFDFELKFDHVSVYDLDLVAKARIHLEPHGNSFVQHQAGYRGSFQTDYFILESLPFEDLSGTFELSAGGIKRVDATWGDIFQLKGSIPFGSSGPEAKLSAKVDGFHLGRVRDFMNRPLRKSIGGVLKGKVRILGPLKNPEFIIDANVKQGWVGQLHYDRGVAHARGSLPYLPLSDSKIMRGRTALDLGGALDFTLSNPFYGIEVRSGDKLILWNGWQLNTSEGEGDLEIGRLLENIPALSLKAGNAHMPENEGFHEERYVTMGSKLKF